MKRTVLASIFLLCLATLATAEAPTAQPAPNHPTTHPCVAAPADALDFTVLEVSQAEASIVTPAPTLLATGCIGNCLTALRNCRAACGTDVNCLDRCDGAYEGCTCNVCHFCK
ncbi:MAG: hypothetical protein U0002_12065 [Thermoanaerobaculia bacterium]